MTRRSTERSLSIGDFEISDNSDCYVVAEIGHNHQGSVEQAKALFSEAKRCGAHAVKLQKRDNASLYTERFYSKPYDNENSFGPTYGAHREALELGRDEYVELQAYAEQLGITMFATAFDFASVDFLAELDMPAYKIASGDLRNLPLLRYAAEVGRPLVFSTGGGTLEDVRTAYEAVSEINPEVAVLQCTAGYPAEWAELDLRVIETYRQLFPTAVVGYSGHDNGIAMPVAAFVLGGRIVEKHFTLNRALKGTDHRFSLEPQGLQKLCRDLRRVRVALGEGAKTMYVSETDAIVKMSKKIVAARDLPAGHVLIEADLVFKSPGDGLAPREIDQVIGRTLRQPLLADGTVTFEHLDELIPAPSQTLPTREGDGA